MRTVAARKNVALRPLAALDGREGEDHRDRRADQDEGVAGRQVDGQRVGQLVVGDRPVVGLERLDLASRHRPARAGSRGPRPSRRVRPATIPWPEWGTSWTIFSASSGVQAGDGVEDLLHLGLARPHRLDEDALGILQSPERTSPEGRGCCRRCACCRRGGRCTTRSAR